MNKQDFINTCKELRKKHQFQKAYDFLKQASTSIDLSELVFLHNPIFWMDIKAGKCHLSRRKSEDADFISSLWSDDSFLYRFHRLARKLPKDINEVAKLLDDEYIATLSESNTLHWVIKDHNNNKQGILSLVNISLGNRNAEILIGMKENAPLGIGISAMLLLFHYYFSNMQFNKLTAHIFEDNKLSLESAKHIGFKVDGVMRQQVIDPKTKNFKDLYLLSMLRTEFDNNLNKRLVKRYFSNKTQ